jgi:choline monooxygenase
MSALYTVDPDIRRAETLPAAFYRDDAVFATLIERVFVRSWHWIGDTSRVPLAGYAYPFSLLDPLVDEPLLLHRDEADTLRCLSNVCTHRGNLLVAQPGPLRRLVCGYHGRRFAADGTFQHMPEFAEAVDFPRACDNLRAFPLREWGPLLFTALDPAFELNDVLAKMDERIGFLPLREFRADPTLHREYLVRCHWALYCDNYLEGFHIPFVHADLNAVLDYGSYATELFPYGSLQIGYADSGEEVFDLPPGHPDYGRGVAAYYFWIFPNLMFNFYPWGLSINVVKPLGPRQTRVSFITYVYDESKLDAGAGALLDKVEREDEFVVEGVQRGLRSRYYRAGRYSPTREQGVHHFHRLLATAMKKVEAHSSDATG